MTGDEYVRQNPPAPVSWRTSHFPANWGMIHQIGRHVEFSRPRRAASELTLGLPIGKRNATTRWIWWVI